MSDVDLLGFKQPFIADYVAYRDDECYNTKKEINKCWQFP